jgi:hypothetical protein
VSRRASLPGADELFRRTSPGESRSATKEPARPQEDKSTKLQVAESPPSPAETSRKAPRHDEKVTFYCTGDDLMNLEKARLSLRSEHGIAADRGRIVRAALAYVLEDFEARSHDSILLRKLTETS